MRFKQIARITIYILPVILATLSLTSPDRGMFLDFGSIALYLLIGIMFLKPLWVMTKNRVLATLLGTRRELGIATFWLFFFHAAGLVYTYDLFSPSAFIGIGNYLFWGASAGIGLIVLGLTSNDISVRWLKHHWKRIQWLAYPAFVAALLHVGLIRGGKDLPLYAGIAVVYIIMKIIEFRIQHKRNKSLQTS